MATSTIAKFKKVFYFIDPFTDFIFDQSVSNLATLMSSPWTGINEREIKLEKNRITQKVTASSPTGTTFGAFLISNTARYLGNNIANGIAALTAADFKSFDIAAFASSSSSRLCVYTSVIVNCANSSTSQSSPVVYYATRNPETGEITYTGEGFTTFQDTTRVTGSRIDLMYNIPDIVTNKNIAVIYLSRKSNVAADYKCYFTLEY